MSIFEQGEAMLDRMFEAASKPVSYLRDGVTLASDIPAKLGRTLFRTDDLSGSVTLRFEQRDFIVRTSDAGSIGEPKKGDEIVFGGKTYQVSAPDGEPCWRWHTRQSHSQLRIHAKYAGDAEEASQ
jgi:hypothetical protein